MTDCVGIYFANRPFDRSSCRTDRHTRRNSTSETIFLFVVFDEFNNREGKKRRERERERIVITAIEIGGETRRLQVRPGTVRDPAERRRSHASGANQYFFQQTLNFDCRLPLVFQTLRRRRLTPVRE